MSATPRRVVITGANRGLGLALARALKARGDTVLATCRDPETAEALMDLEPAWLFPVDIADPESVESFAHALRAEKQGVDVLINNAGINATALGVPADERDVLKLPYDALLLEVHVNAIGPLLLTRALFPALKEGSAPVVMNVSSQLGSLDRGTRPARDVGYNVSKASLNMITRALAAHPEASDVTCLAVHPGWVRTDMGGEEAPVTPEASATALLKILDNATPEQSGTFLDWNGAVHPW